MAESRHLGDGSTHCDRSWIIRTRVRTGAAASPISEIVTGSRRGSDRQSRSARSPAAGGTHAATDPMVHREEILGVEIRCVSRVCGWSNGVRDSSAITPPSPHVPNACVAVLRRSCSDGVA